MRNATIILTLASLLTGVRHAEAGLFDWLFGPKVDAPVTAYYPPQIVATETKHLVVNYRPQVRYRSTWARVPVTTYRPVTTANSAGCTTSCMRPCTTYEWQRRRVPVTTYRPYYRVVQGGCQVVRQPISNCNSCDLGTSYSSSPTTGGSYYEYPAGTSSSSSGEAADDRPRLRGEPTPNTGDGTSVLRKENPVVIRRQPIRPLVTIRRPGLQTRRSEAAAPNGYIGDTGVRNKVTLPTEPNTPTVRGSAHQGNNKKNLLRAIPDPERHQRKAITPPALIQPNARTAQRHVRQAWAAAPIEWARPVSATRVRPAQLLQQVPAAPTNEHEYDDSGWTSLAN